MVTEPERLAQALKQCGADNPLCIWVAEWFEEVGDPGRAGLRGALKNR